jgi:hypothetical protein
MPVAHYDNTDDKEESMASIPSLKWPLIWLVVAGYLVVASFIDFTVGIDDARDAEGAMYCFPFLVIGLVFAFRWLRKRLAQRQQWRETRLMEWILSDLPAPEKTDWEAIERQLDQEVGIERRPGGGWRHV